MKGLKKFLNKYGFIGQTLSSIPLHSFEHLFQILCDEVESKNSLLFDPKLSRLQKMSKIIQVCMSGSQTMTLYLVVKKIAVLFMMSRRYIQKMKLDEELRCFFQDKVKKIINDDATALLENKQCKATSLTKIYQYIRALSGSKETEKDGLTKIEDNSQKGVKGALKETLSKAVVPFCTYILKILQEYESYRQIFKCQAEHSHEIRWKFINWSLCLGQITNKICGLSRYFTNDFQGVLVFIVFLCSKDLAPYYDQIKTSVQKESIQVLKRLLPQYRPAYEFPQKIDEEELRNLRVSIEEMTVLKQKLNGIYGSRILQKYIPFFSKPSKYRIFNEQIVKEIQFIMEYTKSNPTCSKAVQMQRKKSHESTTEDHVNWNQEDRCQTTQNVIELHLKTKRDNVSQQRRILRGDRRRIQLVE